MGRAIEGGMKNSKLIVGGISARICVAVCAGALALVFVGSAQAQAPPGPISGAPDASQHPAKVSSRSSARDTRKGNLAGEWKLNRSQSDDPRQRMEQATGSPRGQVGTNGPWGGVGGGGRRGPGSGTGSGRAAKQYSDLMEDYSFLAIAQTEKTVKVTSDSGRLLAYYSSSDQTNSKSDSQGNSKSEGGDASKGPSTHMQGDQLVVVSTREGVKTTRTYAASTDGTQLNLTTRIEGGHLKSPVTILFVYDPLRAVEDDDSP